MSSIQRSAFNMASMRPTPEGVGNVSLYGAAVSPLHSFNEAHARRRGKCQGGKVVQVNAGGFNEAHARRRGK